MKNQIVRWRRRLEKEGLAQPDPGFEKFVMSGVGVSDVAGREIAECVMSVMQKELSIDGLWKKVVKQIVKVQGR